MTSSMMEKVKSPTEERKRGYRIKKKAADINEMAAASTGTTKDLVS